MVVSFYWFSLNINCVFLLIVSFYWLCLSIDCLFLLIVSVFWLPLSIDCLCLLIVSFYWLSLSIDCLCLLIASLYQYLIYSVLIRSNTQVRRNLAQNSHFHPWATLCCLFPRRQTRPAQVRHQAWFSWQCSKSGQRRVPGGAFGSVKNFRKVTHTYQT